MKKILFALFTLISLQTQNISNNSYFDDRPLKDLTLPKIVIEGEVDKSGEINFSELTIRETLYKDAYLNSEKTPVFVGAYSIQGYSLFDIVNGFLVKKKNEKEFKPQVDLYLIIENNEGEKVIVSWGELYYSYNPHKIILTKRINSISPAKIKKDWILPSQSELIFTSDLYNIRKIKNPTKISVKSFNRTFPKNENAYSDVIKLFVDDKEISNINDISNYPAYNFDYIGYGHGMGFKGINTANGILLKDVLKEKLNSLNINYSHYLVLISSKDSYRATYSLSEIMNRADNLEFMLFEDAKNEKDGRFIIFTTADFYVDRNVKAIEKIELINIKK